MLLALLTLNFVPSFGTTSASHFGAHARDALRCVWGDEPAVCIAQPTLCRCDRAWWLLCAVGVSNVALSLLQMALVRSASTLFTFMAAGISTPLLFFVFSIKALNGADVAHPNWYQVVSLIVVVLGVVLYRVAQTRADKQRADNDERRALIVGDIIDTDNPHSTTVN
jgi:multidrug transporter EmrE-like cation transporter